MATLYPGLASRLAEAPGVQAVISEQAALIAARARALLASHRRTGRAHIEVTTAGGGKDRLVSLVDPAALSIEFGHTAPDGTPVAGLYVITRAAGL